MAAYLDLPGFRLRTLLPAADVDELEMTSPGWIATRIAVNQGWIDARLNMHYAVPFGPSVPEVVLGWLEAMTTLDAYLKRGYNPGSAQDGEIKERATTARAEVKEAADAKDGLFDLPLRESDHSADAVTKAGPLGYSEASPYVAFDQQIEQGTFEDDQGRGTTQ